MMGLPVAVFLHNRFSGSPLSFLFFFPRRPRPRRSFGDVLSSGWPLRNSLSLSSQEALLAFFGIAAYISLRR